MVTTITLRDRSGRALYACQSKSVSLCIEKAVAEGVALDRLVLRGADLRRSNLDGGRFRGADLRGCDFTSANLADCDLSHADLSGATLIDTCLAEADLRQADLRQTLWGATLVSGARFHRTTLPWQAFREIGWADVSAQWPLYMAREAVDDAGCDANAVHLIHDEPFLLHLHGGWVVLRRNGDVLYMDTTLSGYCQCRLMHAITHGHDAAMQDRKGFSCCKAA